MTATLGQENHFDYALKVTPCYFVFISGFVKDSSLAFAGGCPCPTDATPASGGGGWTSVDGAADTAVGTDAVSDVAVVDTGGFGSVATGELLLLVASCCCCCEANCFWAWTALAAATAAMEAAEGPSAEPRGAPPVAGVDFGVVLAFVMLPVPPDCDAAVLLLLPLLLRLVEVPSAMETWQFRKSAR